MLWDGNDSPVMTFQAMLHLGLWNALNLAQQLMRDVANFETTTQLLFQMKQQTCGHLRIG